MLDGKCSQTLQNTIGDSVFSFAYNDVLPWPLTADGAGGSLHRVDFRGSPDEGTRWTAGLPTPGFGPEELRVENIAIRQATDTVLTFTAFSNRTYSVQHSSRLMPASWAKLADVPARATNRVETVLAPNSGETRFFRLVTPQQP